MLDWSIPIKQKKHIQPVSPDLLARQWCPKHSHTPQACHAMGKLGATAHLFLLPFSWEAFNDQHLLRSRRPTNASGRLNLGDVAPAKLPFAWNMMIVHEEITWNSLFSERLSAKSTILFQNRIWSLRMAHPPNLQSVCSCGMLNWAASLTDL